MRMGDLSDATRPLGSPTTKAATETYPLYALSPVFTVAEPEPEPTPTPTPTPAPEREPEPQPQSGPPAVTASPVIVSRPATGDTYGRDEAIVVTLTFSEVVTVTGNPRVRLAVGERNRWARYSGADGSTLTFAYRVKKVDADGDGVSIRADRLQLNGGSIADADGNAASLAHPALADQSGHKVDGSRTAPADSEPAADRPGVVSLELENDPLAVGGELRAVLLDPDGGVSNVAWIWRRSAAGGGLRGRPLTARPGPPTRRRRTTWGATCAPPPATPTPTTRARAPAPTPPARSSLRRRRVASGRGIPARSPPASPRPMSPM